LPRSRRLVTDLLHFAGQVPSEGVIGNFNVAALAKLRLEASPRIGWAALFMKAYGVVSAEDPQLRQFYMKWPVPHLHRHSRALARMTVARKYEGEDWVFFARIVSPETIPLVELQKQIDDFKSAPVNQVPSYVHQLGFSRLPVWIRRVAWWWALNVSGARRAYRFGTFGMTSVSAMGAVAVQPKCISGTTLTFGPVDAEGHVDVRIVFDHRLFDGAAAEAVLARLEAVLNSEIADELRSLVPATENCGAMLHSPRRG
jgi:hypothetical protein